MKTKYENYVQTNQNIHLIRCIIICMTLTLGYLAETKHKIDIKILYGTANVYTYKGVFDHINPTVFVVNAVIEQMIK